MLSFLITATFIFLPKASLILRNCVNGASTLCQHSFLFFFASAYQLSRFSIQVQILFQYNVSVAMCQSHTAHALLVQWYLQCLAVSSLFCTMVNSLHLVVSSSSQLFIVNFHSVPRASQCQRVFCVSASCAFHSQLLVFPNHPFVLILLSFLRMALPLIVLALRCSFAKLVLPPANFAHSLATHPIVRSWHVAQSILT